MTQSQITFAHFLASHAVIGWAFSLAAISWLAAAAGILRSRDPDQARMAKYAPLFALGGLGFFAAIGSVFVMQSCIERAGLAEVQPRLFSNVSAVTVDGVLAKDPVHLVEALRKIHHVGAHHSSPLAHHRIVMQTAKGRLELSMARDSTNGSEFWIFNPTFDEEDSEIGRTFAARLADIPPS